MTKNVGIFVFKDVEVLDFTGPFEVFTTADRVHRKTAPHELAFNVFSISEANGPVVARAGLSVNPDFSVKSHPKLDVLVIPGGVVTEELEKPHILNWIRVCSQSTDITASVCTGAFLLAKAGLLKSRLTTTHWEDIPDLRASFPELEVQSGVRWVDQGHVVTSAGITAGIDMSLHLVARLVSDDLAIRTARQLEFEWTKNPA